MSYEIKYSIRDAFSKYLKDPENNKDKLLSQLNKYKEQWASERRTRHDKTWREEIAFYSGNHYVRDITTSHNAYRVRLRENHVNNIMARLLSIVAQNLPIIRSFPASDQDEDVTDAEATEKYGKYYWRIKKIELKYLKFIKYSLIFGNGFLFRGFDPDAGGVLQLGPSETKSGDAEKRIYRGDSFVTVSDPFRVLVRPGIDEMDEMYDFIYSEPVSKAMLEDKHGPIDAEAASALNAYTGEVRKDEELVLQHHYFHAPKNWFDEGMYACWAGKTLIKAVTFPYSDGALPLHHLPFDKPPMGFYGVSSIEQVMDLQEQLNRAASMIVEARNLVARPRVLASHEAQIPAQSLSDRPGEYIKYKLAGGPPKFEVPNFNFGEMANHKADLRNALSSVIGITNASRGEIPAATKTALALQLVLEQDRSQYAPFIKAINQSLIDLYMGIFGHAAQFFSEDDPRIIKIEGDSGSSTLFHGGMVPSPLDLWLEDTNPLGWTPAGRAERIENLVDKGILTDRGQVLDMLKLNSPDSAFDFDKINRHAQKKEIELMKKGQFVEIGPEDDDAVHLEEITKVIASFDFRSKPKPVQDVLIAHAKAHKDRLNAGMQMAKDGGNPVKKLGGPAPAPIDKSLVAPNPGSAMDALLAKGTG